MTRFLQSAFKHGYTEEDITGVLENPMRVIEVSTSAYEPVISSVGVARSVSHIIEVRYERDYATGDPVVIRAQKAGRGAIRWFRDLEG